MRYAGFWRRGLALLIDGLFLWLVSALFFYTLIFGPLAFLLSLFYFPVFHSSELRATPGKYLMGIGVATLNGDRIDFKCAIIRHFSEVLTSFTAGIGYLLALFTQRKQTLHDFLADTIVIEGEFSQKNLWQAWVSQMRYLFKEKGIEQSSDTFTPVIRPPSARASLEDLFELYKKGILSDEEYKEKKEEYLKKL